MARPKKILEEEEVEEPILEIEEEQVKTRIESYPEFDPSLPESKQRHLR